MNITLTPSQRRAALWLLLAAAAFGLLEWIGPALSPVLMACVLAYLLWPVEQALQRRGVPASLAVSATVFCALLLGAVLMLLLVPIVTTLLPRLQEQWPGLLDRFDQIVSPRLASWGFRLDTVTIKAGVLKAMNGNVQEWGARLLSSVRIGGSWLATLLGWALLVPMLTFYILLDARRLMSEAPGWVPLRVRAGLCEFVRDCDLMLRQYLRGQLLVMLVLAVYYALALTLAGLTLAWPIGVFTGLAAFIPYLGYGTGLVLALLTGAIDSAGWHGVLVVAVIYAVGQVVESFFLTPRLVGGRIGLSPLTVIVALLLFAEVFGFVGILLALPASAVLGVAARRAMRAYRASEFYRS